MTEELLGALIGASAAIIAQIVSSILSQITQKRQLTIAEKQLQLSAESRFGEMRLDAIVAIRDLLQQLADQDLEPKEVYFGVRPHLIFLDDDVEKLVTSAIRSRIQTTKVSIADESEMKPNGEIANALAELKKQSNYLWRKYNA